MEARHLLFRRGLPAILGGRRPLLFDLQAGQISNGRQVLSFRDLRFLEFYRGFLTLSTRRTWLTIDFQRYRDASGPLLERGELSESARQMLDTLKTAAEKNAGEAAREPPGLELNLRYRVRVDRLAIVLSILSVAILLVDLYYVTNQWLIDWQGLLWFSALLAVTLSLLLLGRRLSWIRLDGEGVTRKGLFRKAFHPWSQFQEFRRQYGEVELVGEGLRLPLSLGILAAGGTPLVLRRGRAAFFSAPTRFLLAWLPGKTAERNEPPVLLSREERRKAGWWLAGMIALNSAIYFGEAPRAGEDFIEKLVALGARTDDWVREPWRLFTSLFLHGSFFHLFFNMLMLAVLGPWNGRVFGWGRTWALYLGSGVLGNLIGEVIRRPIPGEPAVGSSTAILGLLGALLNATYRYPDTVPLVARARFRWAIPATLLLTLGLGLVIPVLDNGAHLGGFFAGYILAWPIGPRGVESRKSKVES